MLEEFKGIKKCGECRHVTTPKGRKQCYTLTRVLDEQVTKKGLPFYPEHVFPVMDELGNTCKRWERRVENE